MDFNKLFSQSKKGEKPESKFQYILIDNDCPTLFQWENWAIGHLYSKIVRDTDLTPIILSSGKDKKEYVNDFLDYHFSRYDSDILAFGTDIDSLLEYIKYVVERNRAIISQTYENNINKMIYAWIEEKKKEATSPKSDKADYITFTKSWKNGEVETLYSELIDKGFISLKTNKDSFLYYFGATELNPTNIQQIEWVGKRNLCVYLIDQLFGSINQNIWNALKYSFNIKNGAQIKQAYIGNKKGKPDGYILIDEVLKRL